MAKDNKQTNNMDIMDDFIAEPVTGKFEKKESDPTREGQILDVMNSHNLGTSLFRLIPDSVKVKGPDGRMLTRLYRKVSNAFTVKVKGKEDKFPVQYQIPSDIDFAVTGGLVLTAAQADLLKNVRDMANNISKFLTYDNRKNFKSLSDIIPVCQYNKQIVFVYGKLLKSVDSRGRVLNDRKQEFGKVRVFKFAKGKVGSGDFITMFNTALSTKAMLFAGSPAWKREWFERKAGSMDKAVSVIVSRAQDTFGTYSLGVSLETVQPFEITEHDLEVAGNLNSRIFDVTKFDSALFEECLEKLNYVQDQINMLGNQAPAPTATISDAEIVATETEVGGLDESPF